MYNNNKYKEAIAATTILCKILTKTIGTSLKSNSNITALTVLAGVLNYDNITRAFKKFLFFQPNTSSANNIYFFFGGRRKFKIVKIILVTAI